DGVGTAGALQVHGRAAPVRQRRQLGQQAGLLRVQRGAAAAEPLDERLGALVVPLRRLVPGGRVAAVDPRGVLAARHRRTCAVRATSRGASSAGAGPRPTRAVTASRTSSSASGSSSVPSGANTSSDSSTWWGCTQPPRFRQATARVVVAAGWNV